MVSSPESPRGGLGLTLVVATLGFAMFAPIGFLTLPLAALVLTSGSERRRRLFTASLAGGISAWWLVQLGDPPDQVVRTAGVIGCAAFVTASLYTSWTVTHRSLVALAAATLGVAALGDIFRQSWSEVQWWVQSRIGFAAQLALTRMAPIDLTGDAAVASDPAVLQVEDVLEVMVPLMVDFFPATVAIKMLAGFALASVLYYRLTPSPQGRGPGSFRDFRFSEHLGWVAVLALAAVLLLRAGTAKLMAANVLAVAGFLYAVRGAAVAWFALTLAGTPGLLMTALIAFAVVVLLLVIVPGTILLGVVDTGLDLRRRWLTPRADN